jgi:hypothetical protein
MAAMVSRGSGECSGAFPPTPWSVVPPAEPVTFTNNVQILRAPDTSEPAEFYRLLRK